MESVSKYYYPYFLIQKFNLNFFFISAPCTSNPCGVYGLCYGISFPPPMLDRFYCVCSPGFNGELCEQEVDECATAPCKNGVCFDLVSAFYCSCPAGYTGQFCEISKNTWLHSVLAFYGYSCLRFKWRPRVSTRCLWRRRMPIDNTCKLQVCV